MSTKIEMEGVSYEIQNIYYSPSFYYIALLWLHVKIKGHVNVHHTFAWDLYITWQAYSHTDAHKNTQMTSL